ncbi:MAG: hypothetical protein ABJD58_10825 [Cyclobacteriaceae bacterium]
METLYNTGFPLVGIRWKAWTALKPINRQTDFFKNFEYFGKLEERI